MSHRLCSPGAALMIHIFICSPETSDLGSAAENRRHDACGAALTCWDALSGAYPRTASPLCALQCICTSTRLCVPAIYHMGFFPPLGKLREKCGRRTLKVQSSKDSGLKETTGVRKRLANHSLPPHRCAQISEGTHGTAQAQPTSCPRGSSAALLIVAVALETPLP